MCRVTLMFGIFGGMDEEVKRKVEDSCFSQQQVCGHLSLNETVGRGFMANFGNLSPNMIRKCCYPSFFIQPHSVLPVSSVFFSSPLPYVAWFHIRHFRLSSLFCLIPILVHINIFSFPTWLQQQFQRCQENTASLPLHPRPTTASSALQNGLSWWRQAQSQNINLYSAELG